MPLRLEGLGSAELPADWNVTLEPTPGIAGVVLEAGEPVVRARIELRWQVPPGLVSLRGTAINRIQGYAIDEVRTDGAGRFLLHGDVDGDLALVVARSGLADRVLLLDGYVAAEGRTDLTIELDGGGVVRGFVLDHLGLPVRGANVVLDHPHHSPVSTRSKRDGAFRFRRVPSGDWYLHVVDELDAGSFDWTVEVPGGWEFPANCAVVSGTEQRQDVVLADPEGASVAGRVAFRGAKLERAVARVSAAGSGPAAGNPFGEEWESSVELAEDGSFELRLWAERDYQLGIESPELAAPLRRAVAAAELSAYLESEFELARVSLRVSGSLPAGEPQRQVLVSWRGDGWSCDARLPLDAAGRTPAALVPAGTLTAGWRGADGESRTREFQLAAGEERDVVLD